MKQRLVFGQLIDEEVKTDRKSFRVPRFIKIEDGPIIDFPENRSADFDGFFWKVNGWLRPTGFQLVTEPLEKEK